MKEPCITAWFMLFWRKPLTRSSPFVTCIRGLVQWVIWHNFEKVLSFVSNLPKSKGGSTLLSTQVMTYSNFLVSFSRFRRQLRDKSRRLPWTSLSWQLCAEPVEDMGKCPGSDSAVRMYCGTLFCGTATTATQTKWGYGYVQ